MAKGGEKFVTGTEEVAGNLAMAKHGVLIETIKAVEQTCVDVTNDAKAGHDSNMAHANQRYRNRTGNLTASIGPPKIVEANFNRVHGIVPAGQEYAVFVEFGIACNVRTGKPNRPYPFISPALFTNRETLAKRLKTIFPKKAAGISAIISKGG